LHDTEINAWLAQSEWPEWTKHPIAGDASSRRYFRLKKDSCSPLILMIDVAGDTDRFALMSRALYDWGLAAPDIYFHDSAAGIMVISDLGTTDFAAHIASHPADEVTLYRATTDVLRVLHDSPKTLLLNRITPEVAADMIGLAAEHYATQQYSGAALRDAMLRAYTNLVNPDPHLALRDFHAENLIWRPAQEGSDRVGLLDFQDAVYAPAGYDLMSLLRDARRDVSLAVADEMMAHFCTQISKNQPDMSAHLACVSVQRNLRILGIFARLASQDGKVKYLSLLPRVWDHLLTDLAHPALLDLRKVVTANLPTPTSETLQRLGAK
jgi:aminoglycoside/choline kinase family phosphotransferase